MNAARRTGLRLVLVASWMGFGATSLCLGDTNSPAAGPRPLTIEGADPGLTATVRGPQFHAPAYFHAFEDSGSPRIERLRKEYKLEEVVRGETDEFRKLLKLRHWVHSRWPIDNEQEFGGDAFAILEKAKTGAGFNCTHSMRVQHAVMTAMGFVARDLGVDCDHAQFGRSIHHGVNEVWSNDYAKWVLLDAKYDLHYQREGVPLSALEVHEAVRTDGARDIARVQGPDRTAVPMQGDEYPTSSALSYWWLSYHVPLDGFTGQTRDSRLVVFDNPAYRRHTWFRSSSRGLREHWAYGANAFLATDERGEVEWTPGVPEVRLRQVAPGELEVLLRSVTPNLKAYLARVGDGSWRPIADDRFRWTLESVGDNRLELRTQNNFEVEGPVMAVSVVVN